MIRAATVRERTLFAVPEPLPYGRGSVRRIVANSETLHHGIRQSAVQSRLNSLNSSAVN